MRFVAMVHFPPRVVVAVGEDVVLIMAGSAGAKKLVRIAKEVLPVHQ